MTETHAYNCYLCGLGGCTEAQAKIHPEDNSKIYVCEDCEQFARKAQAALDTVNCRHTHYREIEQTDGWPGGDILTVECQVCGKVFKVELPQ